MSRNIGNSNQAEADKNTQWPVEFIEMIIEPGNPNATVRFTNLFHEITIQGKTYLPSTSFLSISSVRDNLQASDEDLTLTLSGVTQDIIGLLLNHRIPGSAVNIYRGFYNEDTGQLVEDPYTVWEGIASSWNVEDDETFSSEDAVVVTVECRSIIESVLGRKRGLFTSPASIQRYYNGELRAQAGFEIKFSGAADGNGSCTGGTSTGEEADSVACNALGGTWTITDSADQFTLVFDSPNEIFMEDQPGTKIVFHRGEGTGTAGWGADTSNTAFYCNPGKLTGAEIAAQVLSAFNGNKIHNSSGVRTDTNRYEANVKSGHTDTIQFFRKEHEIDTAPPSVLLEGEYSWKGIQEDAIIRNISVSGAYLERSFDFVAGLGDKDIEFGKPRD